MLTRSRTNRLSALSAALVAGLVTLPLVVAFAINPEQTAKTPAKGQQSVGAQAAILRGRVTDEAGAPWAMSRVRVAIPATDMRFVYSSTRHKQLEAKSGASGDYRLEIPGITERTTISIDAMKPGYGRLVGTLRQFGDHRRVDVAPGQVAEASRILKPALYIKGILVDEQGKPISGIQVSANLNFARSSGGIELTASNSDGAFELFNYDVKPEARGTETGKGHVIFSHPDYINGEIADVYALAPKQRDSLRIVIETGYKMTGTVLDVAGKPVPNATIRAVRKDGTHRKATMTDANGKFALRGLSKGLTSLSARALNIKQMALLPMALNSDKNDLEVRLTMISLPTDLKQYSVLGMLLTDATPELKSAYDLRYERGALILDPGKNSDQLKIRELGESDVFWMVGRTRIGTVREFVDQILAETAGQNAEEYRVRVVYASISVRGELNTTRISEAHKG